MFLVECQIWNIRLYGSYWWSENMELIFEEEKNMQFSADIYKDKK